MQRIQYVTPVSVNTETLGVPFPTSRTTVIARHCH